MENKKVSIGIPTFNEERSIVNFFSSLKRQSINDKCIIDEIIFVDDSDDKTPQIINKLALENPEYNIRLLHNYVRQGASHAWNTIFKNAKGDIIVLLDADIKLTDNCLSRLTNKIHTNVGLCASNSLPIIEKNNIFSNASGFIAYWLRSIRLHGLSQYTTMGRALAIDSTVIKDLEIPKDIIAIDLYLQCKVLEKNMEVIYDDGASIYFNTPLNIQDFLSQVTRAIKGHSQIKEFSKKFNLRVPISISIIEFVKNSIKYPRGACCLMFCYTLLPFIYHKNKKNISYLWEMANSTKS